MSAFVVDTFIVDTNVPIVANAHSAQADPACVLTCIRALLAIQAQSIVLLDEGMLILTEYMRNLCMSGQPGAGDFFMKWVWSVQADPRHCKRIPITPLPNDSTNFAEFPNDADLAHFDRSDRKFVAVALASNSAPEILNAVDSDWADFAAPLARYGLHLHFLCPQHVPPPDL